MVHTTRGERSGGTGRLVSRALLVAAVVGITLLGNLRLQASEVHRTPQATTPRSDAPRVLAHALALTDEAEGRAYPTRSATAAVDPDADSAGTDASDDAARLVPAIYAWDPDVRFVYYRHVSKWM
jgi:hypothetical protein